MYGCVDGVYRLSCLCCLGGDPGIELMPHPGRPSKWPNKCVCDPESQFPLPTGRGSVRRGWRESRKDTCNGEVKLSYE